MSHQAVSPAMPDAGRLHLSAVDWRTYTRLMRIFDERPGYRLTYDRGELEILSPSLRLDKDGRFLGRLAVTLTEELQMPVLGGGSVTMRLRRRQRGLEADDCFWIANAAQLAGKEELDLRRDPPPDLAIESDVTSSSLDRMSIYEALRVPEVWRLDRDDLTFTVVDASGRYRSAPTSAIFPWLAPADLLPFVQRAHQAGDQNAVVRAFRAWIQQRRAALGS